MSELAIAPTAAVQGPAAEVTMRLLVSCPDRPGIVAAVARFLYESGANIVRSDQYSTDPAGGAFFLRMEFALAPEARRLRRALRALGLRPVRHDLAAVGRISAQADRDPRLEV
jgi:formyltetrahydrofolate hydrolase